VGQYFITEHISIGSTMAYLLYMQKIVDNFGEMSNQLQAVAKVQGSSYKIAELIIKAPKVVMKENGLRTTEIEGVIKIEDVKFNYPSKKDVQVLKGVTIEVPNNQIIAIVGASGKSNHKLLTVDRMRKVLYYQSD
jgi:ABC-type bacteriocin/lantibiotic exporter with double-glycine peptidase domain